MGRFMQFVCTLIISNLCLGMGMIFAWPSSTFRLFESTNTTLHRPMTETELALFGSLTSIGALIATPVVGIFLDRLGRKKSAILSSLLGVIAESGKPVYAEPLFKEAIPSMPENVGSILVAVVVIVAGLVAAYLTEVAGRRIAWTMLAFSSRVEVILSAMFICGLSGAAVLVVPVYISEICEESIRGAMCSCTIIFYGVGLLISYLLGGFLTYSTMLYVCLTMTVMATSALIILKESPTCLMIKGLEKEAAVALGFYRSVKPDSKIVQEELNTIRRSLNPELDDITPEEEKQLKPEKQNKEKMGLLRFIKKSRSTRAAIYMTLTLVTASIFQGLVVVQVYAEPLFEEAIPSMSPNVCSILLAVVAIVAGLVAAYLTELAGRRPLLIYSSFGTAASCLLLGLQLHLHWGPNWMIAVNIYIFTTVFSLGGGTVPYVLIAEVFLPEVKSFMSMLVMEWAWLCNSVILFIFNPLLKAIGLGPVFYIFAGVSALTGIYSIFFVPETRGLTIDAIQERFTKKKKRDVIYS